MIPTLIVAGFVLGRWWPVALVLAAAGWPVLLVATGTVGFGWGLVAAAGLAVLNVAAGVALHRVARSAVRLVRAGRHA